jgi:hypothetical protein
MADNDPVKVLPRARWLLRSVLPLGVILLVLWIATMVWQLADGQVDGLRLWSAVLGLATSVILIVTGREYRRRLPPEDDSRNT